MFKRKYLIVITLVLTPVLLGSLVYPSILRTQTKSIYDYDPWYDLNDDGTIDIFDLVILGGRFGSSGTPINKTALLLELQSKIESLNATIVDLENTINYLNSTVVYLNETVVYLNRSGLGTPDYDSGWLTFPTLTWVRITHNLGTRDIIVYMLGKNVWQGGFAVHQRNYGGDNCDTSGYKQYGAFWESADDNSIYVYNTARGGGDDFWERVRVLIWRIP